VVDCESSMVRLGLAERLAVLLRADLYRLDQLEASSGLAEPALASMARQLTRGRAA
jgi:Mg-chelatase subunit ChlD